MKFYTHKIVDIVFYSSFFFSISASHQTQIEVEFLVTHIESIYSVQPVSFSHRFFVPENSISCAHRVQNSTYCISNSFYTSTKEVKAVVNSKMYKTF